MAVITTEGQAQEEGTGFVHDTLVSSFDSLVLPKPATPEAVADQEVALGQFGKDPTVVRLANWADIACDDCGNACGCTDGCDSGCCSACGPKQPRVYAFGEFLYLAPADADVTHAQQQDGLGAAGGGSIPGPAVGAGVVPFGRIGTIGFDYEPAYRVGAGFRLDCLSSIAISYTNFQANATDTVDFPTAVGGGFGAVASLVQLPLSGITASTGPVTAFYDIDFQLADVLFRDVWKTGCDYEIRYSLGAQYGNLNQEFLQQGTFSGGNGGPIDTSTDIEFDGGGLKFGLEVERFLHPCLMVYGRASGAAMVGRFNGSFNQVNTATLINLGNATWEDDRFITQTEFELGIAVTALDNKLRLSGGFLASHWGNVVTTDEFIQAVQTNDYVDIDGDLSFNGLVGRVEYAW